MKHHRSYKHSLLALVLSVCMLFGSAEGVAAAIAAGEGQQLTNVALHKPAYTDTVRFSKVPAYAVDGDRAAGSHCDMGETLPASLTVDLLAEYDLAQINVTTYYDGARYYDYDVFVSLDNVTFERVCGKNDETPASASGETYDIPVTKARYVRVTVTKLTDPSNPANSGAHIVELAAMAQSEKQASPLISGGAAVASEKGVPARINDGDFASYWDGAQTPSSFVMDLGGWYDIDQIELWPYFASKGRVYHYTVYASKDKVQYEEIARKEDDRPVSTTGDIYRFDNPVLARYVKVEMTHNSANASVHMNEMRVYGTPSEYEDPSLINIARGKPAYSMAGTPGVITDGNYSNYWDGSAAPSEFEIDLEKWYDLSKLVLFPYFGDGRYYHYEIYTSCNGLDYTLLSQKDNDDIAVAAGDTYATDGPVLARFIKVRMTYNSANPSVHMKELEAYGLLTDHEEPVFELPGEDPADPDNIAFGKPVRVPMNSYYAPRITDGNNDTYWGVQYYPSYADIDLKENYALSDITVIAPAADGITAIRYTAAPTV